MVRPYSQAGSARSRPYTTLAAAATAPTPLGKYELRKKTDSHGRKVLEGDVDRRGCGSATRSENGGFESTCRWPFPSQAAAVRRSPIGFRKNERVWRPPTDVRRGAMAAAPQILGKRYQPDSQNCAPRHKAHLPRCRGLWDRLRLLVRAGARAMTEEHR